jgi:Cu/Ag efflux pump CusA
MALTVIYGLVFATFLTLVVVPVMMWLMFRFRNFMRRIMSSSDERTLDEELV